MASSCSVALCLVVSVALLPWGDAAALLSGAPIRLHDGWRVCRADGDAPCSTSWPSPRLPTTALNALIAGNATGLYRTPGPALRDDDDDDETTNVDPYYGENLAAIRDVNETGAAFYTLRWERELLFYDDSDDSDNTSIMILELAGVNYRATVYVDGQVVAPIEAFGGLFARRTYLLLGGGTTRKSRMTLAVKVEPPDHPGSAACGPTAPKPCGQGGDHSLAQDVTSQFMLGWDWARAIPDRSTGFFGPVTVRTTTNAFDDDLMELRDAAVQTLTLSCGNENDDECRATADATVRVVATARCLRGSCHGQNWTLVATLPGGVEARSPPFTFDDDSGAGETCVATRKVTLRNASLWWPRGVWDDDDDDDRNGDASPEEDKETRPGPALHFATVKLEPATEVNDNESEASPLPVRQSTQTIRFGARVLESVVNTTLGGRYVKVNGRRTYLVGGNWIATDAMFRYSASAARYRAEVALHAAAGLNAIRVWGGGVAERDEFYEACDEFGLLVYQEFWMSGDNNGRWAGSYDWPLDGDAYARAVSDVVKRLRKFPSLLGYGGGNELYPPDMSPPAFADAAIRDALDSEMTCGCDTNGSLCASTDDDDDDNLPPSYLYVPSSMDGGVDGGDASLHDDAYALAPKDGPYGMLLPEAWGHRNPGMGADLEDDLIMAFQPEIGSASVPAATPQLLAFLSRQNATPPAPLNAEVDDVWTFHNYLPFTSKLDDNATNLYDQAYAYAPDYYDHSTSHHHRRQNGPPTTRAFLLNPLDDEDDDDVTAPVDVTQRANVSEWLAWANAALFQQNQLLFESHTSRVFASSSAVFLWKSQSPWPALRGYLYDWSALRPNGVFRGSRAANRHLKSPRVDLYSLRPRLANRAASSWTNVSLTADWFDLAGTALASTIVATGLDVPPTSALRLDDAPLALPDACASSPSSSSSSKEQQDAGGSKQQDVCVLRLRAQSNTKAATDVGLRGTTTTRDSYYWRGAPRDAPSHSSLGALRLSRRAAARLAFRSCDAASTTLGRAGDNNNTTQMIRLVADLVVADDSPELLFYPELTLEGGVQDLVAIPTGDHVPLVLPGDTSTQALTVLRHHLNDDPLAFSPGRRGGRRRPNADAAATETAGVIEADFSAEELSLVLTAWNLPEPLSAPLPEDCVRRLLAPLL